MQSKIQSSATHGRAFSFTARPSPHRPGPQLNGRCGHAMGIPEPRRVVSCRVAAGARRPYASPSAMNATIILRYAACQQPFISMQEGTAHR